MEVQAAGIFLIPGWLGPEVRPYVIELGVFLLVLLAPMLVSSVAVFALPESRARNWIVRSGLAAFLAFAALVAYFSYAGPQPRLACDGRSAVWPLDIQYSDYRLEERSKVDARMAADGGSRE